MGIQTKVIKEYYWYPVAGLLFAALALSYGFSFGNVGNQQTYLPHTLNYIDPSFLQYDWLVRDTTAYHGPFRWVVGLLNALGSIALNMAIANVLCIVAGLFAIYRIAMIVDTERRLATAAFLLAFICFEQTQSVSDSYIFSSGLQPSSLASAAWLAAIYFYLNGSLFASGLLLGVGGLFHVNFLVLGIGLFTLVHLTSDLKGWAKRVLLQVGPSLILLAVFAPLIFAAAAGDGASTARDIFQRIRAPHHYLPAGHLFDFLKWGGWTIAGFGAISALAPSATRTALLRLFVAITICVAGATLLTTIVFIPSVSQLFVWRLAPFGILLSQIALATLAASYIGGESIGPPPVWCVAMVAFGAACIVLWYLRFYPVLSKPLLTLAMAAMLVAAAHVAVSVAHISRRVALRAASVGALLIVGVQLPAQYEQAYRQSVLIAIPHAGLYDWVKQTPPDTQFMIPPEFGEFRLFAERGIVVDWKSTPVKAAELIEWHRRIESVAGRPVNNLRDAIEGYRSQDISTLRATAARYRANYIIVDRKQHAAVAPDEVFVFATPEFGVLRVR